jgi:LysM repeat protein
MSARSRARYLAPIALIATIAGTYVIVHGALNPKPTSSRSQTATNATNSGSTKSRKGSTRSRFYSVKAGDSLTSIASKTGVAVTTIEALNPHIDPNSLQRGQRVRLRR